VGSSVFSPGVGVCFYFSFVFVSLASLVLLLTLYWLTRRCSLTSALFCISVDFGSNFFFFFFFLSFWEKMLQKKRRKVKKKNKKSVVSVLMSK